MRRRSFTLTSLLYFLLYLVFVAIFAIMWVRNPRNATTNDMLDGLELDCEEMMAGNYSGPSSVFEFDGRKYEDELLYSKDRCETVSRLFRFYDHPLSQEEADFPIAYGILAYKDTIQFLFMLSSFYHPQNEYCVAVGENAPDVFKFLIKELTDCWPNVHFLTRPPIFWGSHEIINSVYTCLEFLSHLKSDWRYFQYLSGVDAPLKSNLEMVRILKALNSTANFELKEYQEGRLNGKKMKDSPLPLYKSSISALIPRNAANSMSSTLMARNVLKFLEGTGIADESFWGTMFGNRDQFDIEGAVDGKRWIEYKRSKNETGTRAAMRYYISRYQLWKGSEETCAGKYTSGSCVFGVGDVAFLVKLPALVAHKFYINYQPAALFCILKEIRRRAENPLATFDTSQYEQLPHVKLRKGYRIEDVDRDELT